jgi:peptidoglycan/LPS O-acetylase OafA/YrhL
MSDRSRQPVLEGSRGLLVSGVVGYHSLRMVLLRGGGSWGDVSPWWWWAGTGRLGVDAFFVLAGFLIVRSWRSCQAHAASWFAGVRDFASRRLRRLVPPYLVMLAVVIPFTAPELVLHRSQWPDLLRLTTLQGYLSVDLPSRVNTPIWSLTTELHFYLVVPLVAWLVARFGGWRTVPVAIAVAVWWLQNPFRGDLAAGLLPGRIDQFLVGAAAGALLTRVAAGHRSRLVEVLTHRGALTVLVLALLAVGTYHGATYLSGDHSLMVALTHPVAGLVLAGLLVRLVCGPAPRLLVHPVTVWLGTISFSLYLWHYPILDQGLRRLGVEHFAGPQAVLAVVVLLVVAVATAALAHRLVEVPASRRRPVPAPLPVVEPELRLQDLQEVSLS